MRALRKVPDEVGGTVRYALESWSRTARLALLLVVACAPIGIYALLQKGG